MTALKTPRPKILDTVYQENYRPDSMEGGAIKRARRVMLMQRAWPLCVCQRPLDLQAQKIYFGEVPEVRVYLWCDPCTTVEHNKYINDGGLL